ncbi:MAG: amidase [Planctomycetota bacterium]|jgi:Asp-tRNA(Asn)/Glu-tRNA(Gln) amidotransferase A subunit family amidase
MTTAETPASRRTFILGGGTLAAAAAVPAFPAMAASSRAAAPVARQDEGDDAAADTAVTAATLAAAERLAGVAFTPTERAMILEGIGEHLARLEGRQSSPLVEPERSMALAFDPRLPGMSFDHLDARCSVAANVPPSPPDDDTDLAFSPVTHLSAWIRQRRLTCQRLTRVYLDRVERFGPRLECVVTSMAESALERARELDVEMARGHWRGPLHGIPWGAKDLLDTAGVKTTWGAAPYRSRVPDKTAHVVRMLDDAGAVLLAKLSLGALAYNDIWFGGRTRNPFDLEQGSSGSSAGSAAATAAGLAAFTIGTETYGSIVSPCMRCGTTGLRPTFGRVGRSGAMPLCWSLDKIGPIARTVEDCMLVLDAINGFDAGDRASIDLPVDYDGAAGVDGLRVGYRPDWFGEGASEHDRAALEAVKSMNVELVEIEMPSRPWDALLNILLAEAAAVFEVLTRTNRDDELTWQSEAAWPNTFRQAWFIPAIEYIQADRLRLEAMELMDQMMRGVDCVLSPSFAASLLLITNTTGHPCLTLRSGFQENGTPRGVTLWGGLFEEGKLARLGVALEQALDVWHVRPEIPEA